MIASPIKHVRVSMQSVTMMVRLEFVWILISTHPGSSMSSTYISADSGEGNALWNGSVRVRVGQGIVWVRVRVEVGVGFWIGVICHADSREVPARFSRPPQSLTLIP